MPRSQDDLESAIEADKNQYATITGLNTACRPKTLALYLLIPEIMSTLNYLSRPSESR